MNRNKIKEILELAHFLAKVNNEDKIKDFMIEILTEAELKTLAKRWRILNMLSERQTQRAIAKELQVSLCKVTRGAKILKRKNSVIANYLMKIKGKTMTKTPNKYNIQPTEDGYYGNYGGQYLPDELKEEFKNIYDSFMSYKDDPDFNSELNNLLTNYAGRPSPVYFAKNLSKKYGCSIYLKREDLNHTGAHKINHSLGEALLAKRMGKTKLIAETGAGQHGVAIATSAALMGLACDIYMGEVDVEKERPNVDRMKILGANIIPVSKGTGTLKEAVDEAFNAYTKERDTALYAIGSAVGPHPFPMMIEHFQSVIGREARAQFMEMTGRLPDCIIACIGGGSNAIGLFSGFLEDSDVEIFGVEPLGKGAGAGDNAASMTYGKDGIIHGFKCRVLQDENGNILNAYSAASGLDYPGVGPKHCYLNQIGRVKYDVIDDNDAINAFYELSREEGIIPALESSHAVAYGIKLAKERKGQKILINLSGRGDKDINYVLSRLNKVQIS